MSSKASIKATLSRINRLEALLSKAKRDIMDLTPQKLRGLGEQGKVQLGRLIKTKMRLLKVIDCWTQAMALTKIDRPLLR